MSHKEEDVHSEVPITMANIELYQPRRVVNGYAHTSSQLLYTLGPSLPALTA